MQAVFLAVQSPGHRAKTIGRLNWVTRGLSVRGHAMTTISRSVLATMFLLQSWCWVTTVSADESIENTAQPPADVQVPPQYEHGDIVVPGAWDDEPRLETLSVEKAVTHLENGAAAWNGSNGCVACHTTGVYLCLRPMLTRTLGRPSDDIRNLFVADLQERTDEADKNLDSLRTSIAPAHIANIAWGLAEWDAHVTGELSDETRRALELMCRVQADDGSFSNLDCWPPFESSNYQAATVAAMAVATAPGWKESVSDQKTLAAIDRLQTYLRDTPPPHLYAEVLLLRAATRWPELMDNARRRRVYADIFAHRNADGGWAMRDFATPENWGRGNRADKLSAEADVESPPSDAHMTALALIVFMDAGMAHNDRLVRLGVNWLKQNQRKSGRWWTRSLNTDGRHLITYSGTIYALAALDMSGSLPSAVVAPRLLKTRTVPGQNRGAGER